MHFQRKSFATRIIQLLSTLDTEAGSAFSKIEDLYLDIKRISEAKRVFRSFYVSSGIDVERWMVRSIAASRRREDQGNTRNNRAPGRSSALPF